MAQDDETQQNSRVHGPPTAAPKHCRLCTSAHRQWGGAGTRSFRWGAQSWPVQGLHCWYNCGRICLTWLGFFSVLFQYSYLARERSQKHQFNWVGMLNFRKTCTLVSQTFELFWTAWKRMENTKLACWLSRFSAHPARLGKSKTTIMRRDLVSLFARPWTSRRGDRMKGYERMRELGIRTLSINFHQFSYMHWWKNRGWWRLADLRWRTFARQTLNFFNQTNYTYIAV